MSTLTSLNIDQKSINVGKGLIMDMVRKANSGHTGGPMSSIDFIYILYKEFLKIDPENHLWTDRDRFVLSVGHESALLYTILTFIGWLSVDDLKQFRQLDSLTPGHPERGLTPGVEATTGPLGQGVGNAVGMAIAESILREKFGENIINHFTYCLHGDGDIQEPVAQGAIALAGHWKLGKLICYYDSNNAQISGKVSRSDSTDYSKMYESHGWHVIEINGHDHDAIRSSIRLAQMEVEKPTIIIGKTIMANGCATVEGDHNTHGAPLSHEEIALTKSKLGLPEDQLFYLPDDVIEDFRSSFDYAKKEVKTWESNLKQKLTDLEFKKAWEQSEEGLIDHVHWPVFNSEQPLATRKAWGPIIESMIDSKILLVGGSADLEPSNVTSGFAKKVGDYGPDFRHGLNFAYGVREFPMGTINNGIAQHGGLKVFGATFFVFSDYERPALRLRALQELNVVSEYTHDSVYVGEDGPTHQPIEHIMACRAIPELYVFRPADVNEAVECSKIAFGLQSHSSIILLTRQSVPVFDRTIYPEACNVSKGAYIMKESDNSNNDDFDIIIFATGSEVWIALEVLDLLSDFSVRVVNIPCWELFEKQDENYKNQILKPSINALRVSIEMGVTLGWEKFTGINGLNFSINSFGKSAPGKEVADSFGFNPDMISQKIINHLNQN